MADALDESPPLRFDIRRKANATIVSVTGEIDIDTVTDLTDALAEPLAGTEHLIVDLTDVGFIDSIGLRGLVDIHIQANATGRKVRLVVGQGATRRPIEISGLDQVLAIFETVDSALA
jgi:anti-sigma B factor antagonist